ncbi:amino acid ABC transporter substrate-binding protein [Acidaminobacter sp. JC074]|uniref:substrate-binding periplasmic protein n=1 Tax=Acidaminobacter sp. JC074 TaxID=2530199 RepID=UPI001F0F8F9A|nr:transporter substrate-binding domain-containing protein [Acidaminobacter sp. JC074]MCH4886377.1 amino acid ABC transporter substrate-binding protein [Acidaminobacter sp. JC074]
MKKLAYLILSFLMMFLVLACDANDPVSTPEVQEVIEERDDLVIRVGVLNEYSPYINGKDDQVSGPYVDIITSCLESLGYEYEVMGLPWSRLVSSVKAGQVDLAFPFFYNVEREDFLVYSSEAIGFSQIEFISLQESGIEYYGEFSDLSGYTIGVVQDYFYTSDFMQAIDDNLVKVDIAITADENIDKLLQGRVDLIVEDYAVVKEYLSVRNIEDNLMYLQPTLTSDFNYPIFRKSTEMDDFIISVNKELKDMKSDGRISEIYVAYDMTYYNDVFVDLENERDFFDQLETLRIGILGETKPYAYYENDQLIGFGVEYTAEALDRIGVNYEFVDIPFARMLQELEKGSLDIATDLYFKEERSEYGYYPKLPYAAYPTVLFKKSSMEIDYSGRVEDLKPYKIGYIRDYYIGLLEPYKDDETFNFIIADTPEKNMENLKNGRVDLIVDIESTGKNISMEMGLQDSVEALMPPVHYDYSYNVFSKAKNLQPLLDKYEMAVRSMHHDGTVEKLAKKYGLPYLEFNEFK